MFYDVIKLEHKSDVENEKLEKTIRNEKVRKYTKIIPCEYMVLYIYLIEFH